MIHEQNPEATSQAQNSFVLDRSISIFIMYLQENIFPKFSWVNEGCACLHLKKNYDVNLLSAFMVRSATI